jgi:hypothetical protein
MLAEVVRASINPWCVEDAGRAVEEDAVPDFLAARGAVQGHWMANRSTGDVLVVTTWTDEESLRDGFRADRFGRSGVAERIGLRIRSTCTMDVIGSHECAVSDRPVIRWARATWAQGVFPGGDGRLEALYREVVPDQARSRGFGGSAWMADLRSGAALAVSLWDGPADLAGGRSASARRGSHLEALLRCRIESIEELEALGVAAPRRSDLQLSPGIPTGDGVDHLELDVFAVPGRRDRSRLRWLGTTLDRPPGALLAQRGTAVDEVVVIVGGHALAVHPDGVRRLGPGDHVGGAGIRDRGCHDETLVAISDVRLHVLSRAEFATLDREVPAVAARLAVPPVLRGDSTPPTVDRAADGRVDRTAEGPQQRVG